MTNWPVRYESGTVQELHELAPRRLAALGAGEPPSRSAIVHLPSGPGVVLGSTQAESAVDRRACDRAGVEVARRRSGGGAVLVEPTSTLWVDLVLPSGDRLWQADVSRAAWWVGEAWAAALGGVGLAGADVWRGALVATPWSGLVCFAGLGAGEVTISGRKVVGISQRRTRAGALFQTACLLQWRPRALVELLALDDSERDACATAIGGAARGVGTALSATLLASFLGSLS